MKKMNYQDLARTFRQHEKNKPEKHLTGYIVFTEDSFLKQYTLESRTYEVSSENKAYMPNMGGYSIYGNSIDGTDMYVRLEQYMVEERGGKDGWRVEYCYIEDDK